MVDRKITGLEVAGSSPVTITFYQTYNLYIISYSLQSGYFRRVIQTNSVVVICSLVNDEIGNQVLLQSILCAHKPFSLTHSTHQMYSYHPPP